jgi:hypothetical protein
MQINPGRRLSFRQGPRRRLRQTRIALLGIDHTALRHTEIVYRSAEEIRKALMAEDVPKALLDLTGERDTE